MLTNRPVLVTVLEQLPFTLTLIFASISWSALVGIPLGCWSAIWRGSWADGLVGVLSVGSIALPSFVVAVYGLLLFSVTLGWFPTIGAGEPGRPLDQLHHLVLPSLAVGLGWVGYLARMVRASMLEVLSENHIRMARAFGLPERVITFRYALKLAIIPTVMLLGIGVGHMISGAVFAEIVFARPGVGRLIFDSITTRNYPVVMGAVMITTDLLCAVHPVCRSRGGLARSPCPRNPLTQTLGRRTAGSRFAGLRSVLSDPMGALGIAMVLLVIAGALCADHLTVSPAKMAMQERFCRSRPVASARHRPSRPGSVHPCAPRRQDRARRRLGRHRPFLYRRARPRNGRWLRPALAGFASGPLLRFAAVLSDRDAGSGSGDLDGAQPAGRGAVVVIATLPGYARMVRAQTMALKSVEFVLAARALGAPARRILAVEIMPNLIGPLLILVAMDIPVVITIEAGMSFLGLGVRPPTPSWGSILNDGYSFIRESPWPAIAGGLPIVIATLGFTFLGETLRDRSIPAEKGRMMGDIPRDRRATSISRPGRAAARAARCLAGRLYRATIVGIIGESGCGKSTLINAIIGLLPGNARLAGGDIGFDGERNARR